MQSTESLFLHSQHVLFVCYGNICRSPFAERYMWLHYPQEKIRSAGILPFPGRRPTEESKKVAREEYGIDLDAHRSVTLTDEQIKWADIIVVMDRENFLSIKERVPPEKALLFLDNKDVEDPYQQGKSAYRKAYKQIAQAIDRWITL